MRVSAESRQRARFGRRQSGADSPTLRPPFAEEVDRIRAEEVVAEAESERRVVLGRNISRMTSSAAIDALDALVSATTVQEVLRKYERLQEGLSLRPFVGQLEFFWKLKQKLVSKQLQKFSKISAILQKLEKRAQNRQYLGNRALVGQRVLVIGGGISGLRVATELLLLGASVLCVEKRNQFTRNNVIHLWPNVISDMKSLGAKRFYGQFCVGAIDHIAIRALQLILLKIALLLGLRFRPNITFQELCPRLLAQKDGVCADAQHCDCCCHSHGFGGQSRVLSLL
ncbi:unnamed protein product [Oppiella nova]|uniref:FAD-binding domain-containing protein n=1 Tax=Oppiella nova TaxID=334625 RepID=A0A7R9LTF1_9ACAR|nr:unnamed protein product [Oppiella nova]CAG2166778.1 unnamed protein product [Oppiella nova]